MQGTFVKWVSVLVTLVVVVSGGWYVTTVDIASNSGEPGDDMSQEGDTPPDGTDPPSGTVPPIEDLPVDLDTVSSIGAVRGVLDLSSRHQIY